MVHVSAGCVHSVLPGQQGHPAPPLPGGAAGVRGAYVRVRGAQVRAQHRGHDGAQEFSMVDLQLEISHPMSRTGSCHCYPQSVTVSITCNIILVCLIPISVGKVVSSSYKHH